MGKETNNYFILNCEKNRYGALYSFTFEQDENKREVMKEEMKKGEPVFGVYEYGCPFNDKGEIFTERLDLEVIKVAKEIEDNCDCWSEGREYLKNHKK